MVTELSSESRAVAAAALACALLCWPTGVGVRRLGALFTGTRVTAAPHRSGLLVPRPGRVMAIAVAGALGGLCAGPAGGLAAAAVAAVAGGRIRAARADRRRSASVDGLLDAIDTLVGELRSGAHPAAAADSVQTGDETVRRVFVAIAATARLGGDLPARLRRLAATQIDLRGELHRMASAWSLADRHGIALADLLDAARSDLSVRRRFAGQIRAQLAGPRASTAVLAGLPLLGLVLGQGIGAGPWQVLTATAAGQLLLLIGVGLVGAGVLWSARIVSKAVPR